MCVVCYLGSIYTERQRCADDFQLLIYFLDLVYTQPQRRRCHNSAMTLSILFTLKTIEPFHNEVAAPDVDALNQSLMFRVSGF